MRRSSMKIRSPATPTSSPALRDAAVRWRRPAPGPRSSAIRTRRRARSGSSANARGAAMRSRPAARSAITPSGFDRGAAGERFGDRVHGEVAKREVGRQRSAAQRLHIDLPRVIVRDHPPARELGGELEAGCASGGARAIARAAAAAVLPSTTTSRSVVVRPSRRSRGAPPTSQASAPASAAWVARSARPRSGSVHGAAGETGR